MDKNLAAGSFFLMDEVVRAGVAMGRVLTRTAF